MVTGLVAIPVNEEADARSNTDSERNKGKEAGDTTMEIHTGVSGDE